MGFSARQWSEAYLPQRKQSVGAIEHLSIDIKKGVRDSRLKKYGGTLACSAEYMGKYSILQKPGLW